ncbi:undecaprenyl-diphosphate phosphatase [Candidatus Dependentiae bacterium]|nr:undecaprenyl-diphosphate phosphatase [Candidatus Dependentiae bacterium]
MFGLLPLAIIQIIVEVLPISSSGHMRLAALLARTPTVF